MLGQTCRASLNRIEETYRDRVEGSILEKSPGSIQTLCGLCFLMYFHSVWCSWSWPHCPGNSIQASRFSPSRCRVRGDRCLWKRATPELYAHVCRLELRIAQVTVSLRRSADAGPSLGISFMLPNKEDVVYRHGSGHPCALPLPSVVHAHAAALPHVLSPEMLGSKRLDGHETSHP